MSLNKIRRIVSGKKARFVDENGVELDLCYITDRIIICGWPASGVEALYRNDRSAVKRFLVSRYGQHYRIFNFCPRVENEYDAAYFDDWVSRFPFPDHHPPPLSLIPLATRRMHDWLSEDARNVVVIHCKAGKGRSGTMCCCYLLSLPQLPQPPQLASNYSKGRRPPQPASSQRHSSVSSVTSPAASTTGLSPEDSSEEDDIDDEQPDRLPRPQSGGAALDLTGVRGEERHASGRRKMQRLVDTLTASKIHSHDDEGGNDAVAGNENASRKQAPNAATAEVDSDDSGEEDTADIEARGIADKLDQIFDLHTSQRMRASKLLGSPSSSPLVGNGKEADQDAARVNSHSGTVIQDGKPTTAPAPDSVSSKGGKQKKPVRGVSIPSQRRFVGYWARVLSKDDPRPLDFLAPPNPTRLERVRRSVFVTQIRIYMPERMPGFPGLIAKRPISVHLSRYRTTIVDELERRELEVREMRRYEKRIKRLEAATHPAPAVAAAPGTDATEVTNQTGIAKPALAEQLSVARNKLSRLRSKYDGYRDEDWDDKTDMFERQGILVQADSAGGLSSSSTDGNEEDASSSSQADVNVRPKDDNAGCRILEPRRESYAVDPRLAIDADREVQVKLLVGNTGRKHALLPDVGALGYLWFIPAFEAKTAPVQHDTRFTAVFDDTEIDFFKTQSGIQRVEVDIEWDIY